MSKIAKFKLSSSAQGEHSKNEQRRPSDSNSNTERIISVLGHRSTATVLQYVRRTPGAGISPQDIDRWLSILNQSMSTSENAEFIKDDAK